MAYKTELNDLFVLIVGTLTTLLTVLAVIVFAFLYQRKLYKKQVESREIEKLLKKEELKSAYAFIEGGEKERKRIAEDLHDNLGSMLSTLKMYTDTLMEKGKKSTDLEHIAGKIGALAEKAADETRRISHNLDSGMLKHFGLKTALLELCEAINGTEKIDVETFIDISQEVDSELSVNIYRVVQELFSNTLKHAKATKIRLEVTQIPSEYISLIFEDNGKGFDCKANVSKGVGLQHIQSRVLRFNGEITIDSGEATGTTVIIELPLVHEK